MKLSPDQGAEVLSDLAVSLGADAVGWAPAHIPASAVAEYAGWLGAGRHAGMDYLERQLAARSDPGSRLEGAASVLWAARLGPDGPTGGFFRDGRPVPW